MTTYREFILNGITYRTNEDASVVEGKDGQKWHQTNSLRVIFAAHRVLINDGEVTLNSKGKS